MYSPSHPPRADVPEGKREKGGSGVSIAYRRRYNLDEKEGDDRFYILGLRGKRGVHSPQTPDPFRSGLQSLRPRLEKGEKEKEEREGVSLYLVETMNQKRGREIQDIYSVNYQGEGRGP